MDRNKLHTINPNIERWHHASQDNRRDEVVLARLRIGHTYLTHVHLLKNEDPPQCVGCDCPLTVEHLLVSCVDFTPTRQRYYKEQSLSNIFEHVSPKNILLYLKEIQLYNKV
jgi:hypothetical protein